MELYQAIILGIIQGFTEFLPISSSAHLVLLPKIMHLPDQGLAFDVMVHFGTLVAVIWYYKRDISDIIYAFFTQDPRQNQNAKIGWGIIVATIPVGLFGLFFQDYIAKDFRSINIIAYSTIFFGLLLYLADYVHRNLTIFKEELTISMMVIIGIFQVLALIPGTSRSGITITGALFLGLSYKLATKFALLLSIPVIILSMILISSNLINNVQNFDWTILLVGFIVSAVVAYITIYFFIKLIEKISLLPFVIYRLFLGTFLLLL